MEPRPLLVQKSAPSSRLTQALGTGVAEGDLFDFETVDSVGVVDIDAVTDVVGVLDEEKDAGAEKFLCCY